MKNSIPLAEISVQQLKRALAIKQEIADLEQALDQLLGAEETAAAPVQRPRKRKVRRAARAKISTAQTVFGDEQKTAPAPEKAPVKKKRVVSAEGRARLKAGAQARWAKHNAEKQQKQNAPVTPEKAPAKKKRKYSPEGKARIIAATKARWARYNAEKKKKAAA